MRSRPHGSFGKHVLTPSLALTSIAAATPPGWRVRYWDENLLQGPPPADPVPAGGRHHRAPDVRARAYELAAWYRAQGSKVVLGGLHVQACEERWPRTRTAVSVGDGVQTWPAILRDVERGALRPRYEAGFERDYDLDPPPGATCCRAGSFLTTDQHHRHARLPQPVRVLLPGDGNPPDALSRARPAGRRAPDRGRGPAVRRLPGQQPRGEPRTTCACSAAPCARWARSGARR